MHVQPDIFLCQRPIILILIGQRRPGVPAGLERLPRQSRMNHIGAALLLNRCRRIALARQFLSLLAYTLAPHARYSGYGLSMPFALRMESDAGPARNSIRAFAAEASFAPVLIPAE